MIPQEIELPGSLLVIGGAHEPHLTAFPLLPRLPLQVVYGIFIVLLELLI